MSDWTEPVGDSESILKDVQAMIALMTTDRAYEPFVMYLDVPDVGTDRRIARRVVRKLGVHRRRFIATAGRPRRYLIVPWTTRKDEARSGAST